MASYPELSCSSTRPPIAILDTDISGKEKHQRVEMLVQTSFDDIKRLHDHILLPSLPPLIKPDVIEFDKPGWKTMEGISFIANYLSEKHQLRDLYVCQTIEAFLERLLALKANQDDFRHAYIVPIYESYATCDLKQNCSKISHQKPDYHAQHKIAVLIERKNGSIKIFVMNSSQSIINMSKTHLDKHTDFNTSEHLHTFFREANLPGATYYYTHVQRHFAETGGCATFALRDAVIFLQDANYMDKIKVSSPLPSDEDLFLQALIKQNGSIDHPFYITNLPPENMKYSQSLSQLNQYIEANTSGGYDLTIGLGRHQRTLLESIEKHIRMEYSTRHGYWKEQNKHLEDRVKKYQLLILNALQTMPLESIQASIEKRLIRPIK